ncbi:MAG: hypothetical protein AUI33_09995 [Ignavibacteria bacterium 13_1_40CM_2_61_4]|nr:MAG: hypothetical protein AUI33_09995 [Ignavibacteria bacterium 13_1_40CM_2_61_4]
MMTRVLIALLYLILARSGYGPAQELGRSTLEVRVEGTALGIFKDIQEGIRKSDLNAYSRHFARQVYLNLPGREGGYFSENQASYILKDYFKQQRPLSFKFSTMSEQENTPYATGGGTFFHRGNAEIFQVYVALKKSDDRWTIAQFSVF